MKSKLKTLELFHGIVLISFSISAKQFEEIKKNKWYEYEPENFENPLIQIQHSATLWLIADEDKASGLQIDVEIDIKTNEWTIFRLEIDQQVFETFLSLRLTGKLPGTLEEAVVEFSLKKANSDKNFPLDKSGPLKIFFSKLFDLALSSNASESNVKTLANSVLSNSIGISEPIDMPTLIEKYFKEKKIPAEKKLNGYLFHIVATGDEWNVEIEINQKKERLNLASYFQIEAKLDILNQIKQDLEIINEEMHNGKFGLIDSPRALYLNSEILINSLSTLKDLDFAFTPIFDSMKAIILLLKEKYGPAITFTF